MKTQHTQFLVDKGTGLNPHRATCQVQQSYTLSPSASQHLQEHSVLNLFYTKNAFVPTKGRHTGHPHQGH